MKTRWALSAASLAAAAVVWAQLRAGAEPIPTQADLEYSGRAIPPCIESTGPDVIVGEVLGLEKWGTIGDITAYSIGTISCNVGTRNLKWRGCTSEHPVIAQSIYRLRNDRFEQVGIGWLKHGFAAATGSLCCVCNHQGGNRLGVGCSDPYVASLNGDQNGNPGGCGSVSGGLGPRWQVNATTGVFPWPYHSIGLGGDAIYKRIQVHNDDVNPSLNPGAQYFAEGHYVTADDAAAGNLHNNASHRELNVGPLSQGGWFLVVTGPTTQERPAIYAWQANNPAVEIGEVDVPEEGTDNMGRYHLGHLATDNGDGTWRYEYALHNMNSHRSARAFSIDVPTGVAISNAAFHDVGYHSGDGIDGVTFDGTDWAVTTGGGEVSWATQTEAENANANALRWGTLYNFRFDADTPPAEATATIGLFRETAGALPMQATTTVVGPSAPVGPPAPACPWDCDGSGDMGVSALDLLELLAQYDSGAPGQCGGGSCDYDGDGCVTVADLLVLLGHFDVAGVGCP